MTALKARVPTPPPGSLVIPRWNPANACDGSCPPARAVYSARRHSTWDWSLFQTVLSGLARLQRRADAPTFKLRRGWCATTSRPSICTTTATTQQMGTDFKWLRPGKPHGSSSACSIFLCSGAPCFCAESMEYIVLYYSTSEIDGGCLYLSGLKHFRAGPSRRIAGVSRTKCTGHVVGTATIPTAAD